MSRDKKQKKLSESLTDEQLGQAEKLYQAITNISDEMVEIAQTQTEQTGGKSVKKKKRNLREIGSVLTKAAAACFVLLLLGTTVVMAAPTLRETTLKMVVKQLETGVDVSFREPVGEETEKPGGETERRGMKELSIGWLPEGGVITVDTASHFLRTVTVDYEDGSNVRIDVTRIDVETMASFAQSEMETEEIRVGEYEATLVTYEDRRVIFWCDDELELFVIVTTKGFQLEETVQIAESLNLEKMGEPEEEG